jgi:multidrug resistance efflux pump
MNDTADKNPPIAWVILTATTTVTSVLWFFLWFRSPWPIVAYISTPLIVIIPAIAGVAAWVRRTKNKRNT